MSQTTFTCQTTANRKKIMVRMEGRLIATYPMSDFEIVASPHDCALSRALADRYAGDQDAPELGRRFRNKTIYRVETNS